MVMVDDRARRAPNGVHDPDRTGAVRHLKPGDLLARRLVRSYAGLPEGVSHPLQMLQALKRAFPRLGITRKALHLYDYLFGLTGKADWHRDRLALVWPSNDRILADLGLSNVSHLKKLMRQLRDLSLIDYKDSPTRARYGRRLPDGTIDYPNSFGIVLNSIAGRHAEFVRLGEEIQIRQRYVKAVKRAISSARRERDDLLEVASRVMGEAEYAARLAVFTALDVEISESGRDYALKEALLARYRTALEAFTAELTADVESPAVLDGFAPDTLEHMQSFAQSGPPAGSPSGPSIRYITAPLPSSGNRLGDKSSGREGGDSGPVSGEEATSDQGGDGTSKLPPLNSATSPGGGVADRPQSPKTPAPKSIQDAVQARLAAIRAREVEAGRKPPVHRLKPAKVSLRQVQAALPSPVSVHIRDDWGFYEVFDHLRDVAARDGLSPLVVDEARLLMGRELACACVAVILAKRGTLRSADNYLRGLMSKYRDGALRIERSLFGIIAERKKRRPETRKLPL